MYKLFGIPNCDTVKKARRFLELQGIGVNFIDFKKQLPTEKDIQRWMEAFGGMPVNKKGQTYRKYKDQFEALDLKSQIIFLKEHSSMIKRPILETDAGVVLSFGFDEESYKTIIS
ncbi:MAG TPA: Spx/MgsR family RNA polymerase-binding regulatory protein [Bacteriovoracaceae bacterium]|nr:Spx/MgsR family RNA polymerase-binding regulatory protein [Bacteriovoracaceae bacterium]